MLPIGLGQHRSHIDLRSELALCPWAEPHAYLGGEQPRCPRSDRQAEGPPGWEGPRFLHCPWGNGSLSVPHSSRLPREVAGTSPRARPARARAPPRRIHGAPLVPLSLSAPPATAVGTAAGAFCSMPSTAGAPPGLPFVPGAKDSVGSVSVGAVDSVGRTGGLVPGEEAQPE